jgi:hypothetical protein
MEGQRAGEMGKVTLTQDEARDIYKMAHSGSYSLREIGEVYGVSHTCVRMIRDRETWDWLWEKDKGKAK